MVSRIGWMIGGFAIASVLLAGCGPKYPDCEGDEHCKEHGEVCLDKKCVQCRGNDQCRAKGPCAFCGAGHTCEKPAGGPGDCCASDLDCKQGKCWKLPNAMTGTCAQCGGDADCGTNMKCVQGSCVPKAECASDADCGAGRKCENGSCVTALCQLQPIYFDFDESAIRADARDTLNKNYDCVKQRGQDIQVEGNCDDRGSDEYNLALGTRRAEAGKKFLLNLGMKKKNVSTVSYGEEKPVCTSQDESCWSQNRRDDFRFK